MTIEVSALDRNVTSALREQYNQRAIGIQNEYYWIRYVDGSVTCIDSSWDWDTEKIPVLDQSKILYISYWDSYRTEYLYINTSKSKKDILQIFREYLSEPDADIVLDDFVFTKSFLEKYPDIWSDIDEQIYGNEPAYLAGISGVGATKQKQLLRLYMWDGWSDEDRLDGGYWQKYELPLEPKRSDFYKLAQYLHEQTKDWEFARWLDLDFALFDQEADVESDDPVYRIKITLDEKSRLSDWAVYVGGSYQEIFGSYTDKMNKIDRKFKHTWYVTERYGFGTYPLPDYLRYGGSMSQIRKYFENLASKWNPSEFTTEYYTLQESKSGVEKEYELDVVNAWGNIEVTIK